MGYTSQVWFQNRRAKWRRAQKAQQLAMGSILQGHTADPFMTMGAQPMTPFVGGSPSPNSSVLMTPKSATTPHHLTSFQPLPVSQSYPVKQQTVVLHHPNPGPAPYQWNSHNRFVFPSPVSTSNGTNGISAYSVMEQPSTPMSSSMQTTPPLGTPLHVVPQSVPQW